MSLTKSSAATQPDRAAIAPLLLAWYDKHRRHLPWRQAPGKRADPYRIWLSEIMLQQTTVKTVIPYFEAFLRKWPKVEALAAAPLDEVLQGWAGLGYYSRARNLHACANVIVDQWQGKFPTSVEELRSLPGIGPYTAGAIASIAFGKQAVAVDGNVERIVARLFAIEAPLPESRQQISQAAERIVPARHAGDFTQAMMDLGSSLCSPRRPQCLLCPLQAQCAATKLGLAETLPRKAAKPKRPVRHGYCLYLCQGNSALLRQRPATGLLGSMMEFPSSAFEAEMPIFAPETIVPATASQWQRAGAIKHVFTHFELQLDVYVGTAGKNFCAPEGCFFAGPNQMAKEALPTLMRKAQHRALEFLQRDAISLKCHLAVTL